MESSLKRQLIQAGYKGEFDLSSLIEACGENFERLHKENLVGEEVDLAKDIGGFEWYAYSYQHQYGGDTPEEAVARLYLALNKK